MTIKVLKIDFRKGKRAQCGKCPVALGCLRASRLLGYDEVSVSGAGIDFWQRGARHGTLARRDLPNEAQRLIVDFDHADAFGKLIPKSDFAPFQFEIEDLPRVR